MHMLCQVAAAFSDVRCPVCGQGFAVYWTRKRPGSRDEQSLHMQQALRAQHTAQRTEDVHPPAFQVSDTPLAVPTARPTAAPSTVPAFN